MQKEVNQPMPDEKKNIPAPDTYEQRSDGAPEPSYHLPVPPPPKSDK